METMNDNSYPICENCIFVNESIDNDPCRECIMAFLAQRIKPNFVSKYKPVTNGDRIRSMSDDELADFLSKSRGGCRALTTESYVCDYYYDDNLNTDCHKCWFDWLNQEVEK